MVESQYLILLAGVVVLAHIVLFSLYRMVHPVFLLIGAFLIFSLFSASDELPFVQGLKWGRLYITALIGMIGVCALRPWHLGPASWALLAFAVTYVLAAVWSGDPFGGLMFKGLFLLTIVAGLVAILVVSHEKELRKLLHCIVLTYGLIITLLIVGLLAEPGGVASVGRLSVLGLNPNRIGGALAPAVIICLYTVLSAWTKRWRVMAYVVGISAAVLVLSTGSRGAAGTALIGCMVLLLPLVGRPILLAAVFVAVGAGMILLLSMAEPTAAERITDVSLQTRYGVWAAHWQQFLESPLYGHGWLYRPMGQGYNSSVNTHSIYMQVLVEMGILGVLVGVVCIGMVLYHGWNTWRMTWPLPHLRSVAVFAWACVPAVLGHGFVESGTLMGSSINALLLAFGVALFDKTRFFVAWYHLASINQAHAMTAASTAQV